MALMAASSPSSDFDLLLFLSFFPSFFTLFPFSWPKRCEKERRNEARERERDLLSSWVSSMPRALVRLVPPPPSPSPFSGYLPTYVRTLGSTPNLPTHYRPTNAFRTNWAKKVAMRCDGCASVGRTVAFNKTNRGNIPPKNIVNEIRKKVGIAQRLIKIFWKVSAEHLKKTFFSPFLLLSFFLSLLTSLLSFFLSFLLYAMLCYALLCLAMPCHAIPATFAIVFLRSTFEHWPAEL